MVEHSTEADVALYGDSDDLSFGVVCDLLANQRRQFALECLFDHAQAIALTDLATAVAVRENEGPLTAIPDEAVRKITTSLYHTHIPKLAGAGAVKHDQDYDMVRISEPVDLIERVLSVSGDR